MSASGPPSRVSCPGPLCAFQCSEDIVVCCAVQGVIVCGADVFVGVGDGECGEADILFYRYILGKLWDGEYLTVYGQMRSPK